MENPRSGGISTGSGEYLTGSVPHDHSLIFKKKEHNKFF
jgi:hypothetical protein